MSKQAINEVVRNFTNMEISEFEALYGVEVMEDNSIFDPIENRTFISSADFAKWFVDQDEVEFGQQLTKGGKQYLDDY